MLLSCVIALEVMAQLTGADEIPNMVIHERPLDYEHKMYNSTNFRYYGPTIVRGIPKFFGVLFNYDEPDDRYAELRFALYNMNKEIVELYSPMRVSVLSNGVNGYVIPCMVNAPAGDYYVVPLFRWEGETDWTAVHYSIFHPDNDIFDGCYQKLWQFKVIEEKLPVVKTFQLVLNNGQSNIYINQAQKFGVSTKLRNPYTTTLKGRIKILHERNIKKFFPGMLYSDSDPAEEFCEVMTSFATLNGVKADKDGAFEIQLSANETKTLEFKNVVTYNEHGVYDQFIGNLYCAFLPEGKTDIEENWIMLQEDCSILFNNGELVYTEECNDYWSKVTLNEAETRNYKPISIVPNPSAVPSIDIQTVEVSYDRNSGVLHLENVPEPCIVRIVSISGTVLDQQVYGSTDGVSIPLGSYAKGMYVISLMNSDQNVVKSFKILK